MRIRDCSSDVCSSDLIGNTTGAVAQTINIGNNNTSSSSTALTPGANTSGSTVLIQGGTGGTALSLQVGATGSINLGTSAVSAVTVGNASSTPSEERRVGNECVSWCRFR